MGWLIFQALLSSLFSGLAGHAGAPADERLAWIRPAAAAEHRFASPALRADDAPGPRKTDPESLGPELTAPSAALIDTRTGVVLFAQGEDRVAPIASITKLMTAMVFLETEPDWDSKVTIADADQEKEGIPYLHTGETVSLRDAYLTTLVGSANNGALALARTTGMSRERFVARMNAKARELGLAHTAFADPSGYEPGNVSTAFDVARLAYFALQDQRIIEAVTLKEVRYRTAAGRHVTVPATNALLASFLNEGDFSIVGGKTGYTEEAGYTLVLRARKGEGDVIGVVLGSRSSDDRFQDLKSLLAWGFSVFSWDR